jgi:hypothetical protein
MIRKLSPEQAGCLALLIAALAYFIIYPGDLGTLLGPLEPLSRAASTVLSVSQAVSPWLYALAAVAVVCWTVLRVWGRKPA